MTIRVVVADDQSMVRSGIEMLLDAEPDIVVVAAVADGVQAVQAVRALRPDVVVMDIRMPTMDGVAATRAIFDDSLSASPSPPSVLALTNFNLDSAVYDVLRAGAAGFILKDASAVDLVRAIRAVHAGHGWLDPEVTRLVIERFTNHRPASTMPDPRLDLLTAREREVLGSLARGLSNAEIAAELFVGEGTVKTHVSHLLDKLAVRDRVQAVVYAYEAHLLD